MKISFFSVRKYDKESIIAMHETLGLKHELQFFSHRLKPETALLADGSDAVVIFVNDTANEAVIRKVIF
ncbi:hypothetical protein DYB37_003146 [Aphanomyces astaci]|uniref:Uncharacterized protein n=1 Tax=Aphanomyces astaci TaxID=112090 RepID=A0A3R7B3C1_APHAT|nr:hypothetical protein DYB37_003146 [Aphanomyces astaci]